MKIPDKVKIGGKAYTVTKTKNLYLGAASASAEIITSDSEIHIHPMDSRASMEVAFLHELVHGIYYFLGYGEQDETKTEQLAQALYMVIVDNPEIFTKTAAKSAEVTLAEHVEVRCCENCDFAKPGEKVPEFKYCHGNETLAKYHQPLNIRMLSLCGEWKPKA